MLDIPGIAVAVYDIRGHFSFFQGDSACNSLPLYFQMRGIDGLLEASQHPVVLFACSHASCLSGFSIA